MFKSFKTQLRKVVRAMAEWPVVGRFVKIAWAIFRLPELRDACLVLSHRQHVLEAERITALQGSISALSHRQHVLETERISTLRESILALSNRQHILETEQLPALQGSILSLNGRQNSGESDRDNLVKSVPISLRKITRELVDIRNQLENTKKSNDREIGEE